MDIDKYKNNGWGLSIESFSIIKDTLDKLFSQKKTVRVVEFGSGTSTRFLLDYKTEYDVDLNITSFDNDEKYMYKHKCVKLRPLVECKDDSFEKMFLEKKIYKNLFVLRKDPSQTRQRNCFYDIREGDLEGIFDLVILDGPNGNGRSLSFLYLQNKIDGYLMIDDYNHYDFVQRAKLIFPKYETLQTVNNCVSNCFEFSKV